MQGAAALDDDLHLPPSVKAMLDLHPLCLSPDTPLSEAIVLMGQAQSPERVDYVLVVEDHTLAGIITAWDIVCLIAQHHFTQAQTVDQVMTQPVNTVSILEAQDPLAVLGVMHRHHIHHLPVLNANQHLQGVITLASIHRVLQPTNLFRLHHVRDVMQTQVVSAHLNTSVLRLTQLMLEQQVSSVVITDIGSNGQEHVPVGIATTQDIVRIQAKGLELANLPAQTIMDAPLFCLNSSDSLWLAHEEMRQRQAAHLVVSDGLGQLSGVIHQSDLLQAMNPANTRNYVRYLRQAVRQLEAEKVDLLQNQNKELERLVQARTAQLAEQAKCDRLLARTTSRIHASLDLQEILNTTVSEVHQLLELDRAIIYRLEGEAGGTVVVESVETDLTPMLGRILHDHCFTQTWAEAYRQGRLQVLEDIYNAGLSDCYVEFLAQFQVRANLVVPILRGQQLWGLLVAQHCRKTHHWQNWEISLLQQLAPQVGIALQQSELYQRIQVELLERQRAETALQELNNDLEKKVEERTASWRQVTDQLLIEIAERNRIEDALRQAKDQLQAVLDAVPGLVSWISADLRYLGVNRHLANSLNMPSDAFVGQAIGFLKRDSKLNQFTRHFFSQPETTALEEITTEMNGAACNYLMVAQKYNKNRAAVLIGIDITDRKRAEAALQESETKFRNLVEQTNDWVWESDRHFKFTYVNPRVEELTGYSVAEILEKQLFDFMSPDETIRLTTVLKYYLAQHEAFNQLETTLIHRSGQTIDLEISGVPVFNAQGELQGYRGITRDITERKQVERDIRKAFTKEKELNELKTRFISMASHEFRTPLTTILASAESLERYRQQWTEEKQLTCLKRIQNSVNHMTKLLNDVLILGKIDAGKLEFNPGWLNLQDFCTDLVEELSLNEKNAQRIHFYCSGEFSHIWGDEKILRHILINLLTNALKYSPPDKSVQFTLSQEDEMTVFQVQDQGIGVPIEDQKRLFDSFHRANNVGNIPGTGLGLAIVKRSVEAHGGKISLVSQVGLGSTFTVALPLMH